MYCMSMYGVHVSIWMYVYVCINEYKKNRATLLWVVITSIFRGENFSVKSVDES